MTKYTHKVVDGRRVPLTAAEIKQLEAQVPEPAPPPLTAEQKLARIGLTIAELKAALA